MQTCGLHRRSMNAPMDLFYKYICLWPGFDINRLFDNPSDGYRRQLPLHSGAKMLLTFGNVILHLTFIYKLYCLKWLSAIT